MPTTAWRSAAFVIGAAILTSCADVSILSPTADVASRSADAAKVDVCHKPAEGGRILEIGAPALGGHLGHGDYVSTLIVSHDAAPTGDDVHFATIGEALASAAASRTAAGELTSGACRITIEVRAGTYQGTVGTASGTVEHFPLIVDVPDITLRGALLMALDDARRATGESTTGEETVLTPIEPLPFVNSLSTPILVANAHPGGSAGNGLVIEGFVFQSGNPPLAAPGGGQAVLSLRATGLTIRGNRVEGGFTESFDLRAGSADVIENHLSGTAGTCDVCLAGPGRYRAYGNRLLAGGIPGMGASPTVSLPTPPGVEPYVLPATAEVWAELRNNEVRNHQRTPVGVGIRMDAVGVGAPNVHGTIHAVVQDNLLVDNRFGIIVHGAFPLANTERRGDVELTLGGNVFQGTCQARLYLAFSRHTFGLGVPNVNSTRLQSSTFSVTLNGNLSWDDAWYYHPAGFGNTLVVDGNEIPNGTRQFYDPLGCPAS